ncbi:MAG: hypothetical protein KF841_12105 [Phycisphaerae bacterium]|nr:hypothetical protein [Phycisphaerae bacterium]
MNAARLPQTVLGSAVTGLLTAIQMIGIVGCSTAFNPVDFNPASPVGLFVNRAGTGGLLGTIRLPNGRSAFLFGSVFESGLIREIDGAVLVDENGDEAFAVFDNGFIKSAEAFDGSTLSMNYDEISTRRVKGRADLNFAAVPESDRQQSIPFDIDLEQNARDLAAKVRELFGIDIINAEPPDNPLAKSRQLDAQRGSASSELVGGPGGSGKEFAREQLILFFVQFHAAAFAALGFILVEILAAVVPILFELTVAVVSSITQAVVIAMFTPFILLGELMRVAVFQPLYVVNIDVDLNLSIPRRPSR